MRERAGAAGSTFARGSVASFASAAGFAGAAEKTGPDGPPISTNGASSASMTNVSSSAPPRTSTAATGRWAPVPVIALNTRLIPCPWAIW